MSRLSLAELYVDGQRLVVRTKLRLAPGTELGDVMAVLLDHASKKTKKNAMTRILRRARIVGSPTPDTYLALARVLETMTPREFEEQKEATYAKVARAIRGEARRANRGPGYYRGRDGLEVVLDEARHENVAARRQQADQAARDRQAALGKAIGRLKPEKQQLVELVLMGHKAPEIAALLHTSRAAVRQRIHRAKTDLRRGLRQ